MNTLPGGAVILSAAVAETSDTQTLTKEGGQLLQTEVSLQLPWNGRLAVDAIEG